MNLNLVKNSNNKISSYLTIQEGCDKFCKFCVVPYTRGPEYSRSISEIIIWSKTTCRKMDHGKLFYLDKM